MTDTPGGAKGAQTSHTYEQNALQLRRQVQQMAQSYRQAQILLTCVELGVFEALAGGSAALVRHPEMRWVRRAGDRVAPDQPARPAALPILPGEPPDDQRKLACRSGQPPANLALTKA